MKNSSNNQGKSNKSRNENNKHEIDGNSQLKRFKESEQNLQTGTTKHEQREHIKQTSALTQNLCTNNHEQPDNQRKEKSATGL